VEQRVRSHPRLLDALVILKEYNSFFECYEKIYKSHGRLFSSIESKYRPILHRYRSRIRNRYLIPKECKFALFLPELDIKGRNSPTIANWLDKINNNKIISRKSMNVLFYSKFFGIIPLGLMDTFPTGQYESSLFKKASELLYNDIPQRIMNFLNKKPNNYEKCAFLIPKTFTNQYGEEVQFNGKPVNKIFQIIESYLSIPIIKEDNLKDIFLWF
jgi:predicted RNA-binding protein